MNRYLKAETTESSVSSWGFGTKTTSTSWPSDSAFHESCPASKACSRDDVVLSLDLGENRVKHTVGLLKNGGVPITTGDVVFFVKLVQERYLGPRKYDTGLQGATAFASVKQWSSRPEGMVDPPQARGGKQYVRGHGGVEDVTEQEWEM